MEASQTNQSTEPTLTQEFLKQIKITNRKLDTLIQVVVTIARISLDKDQNRSLEKELTNITKRESLMI